MTMDAAEAVAPSDEKPDGKFVARLQNVGLSYGETRALDGINIEIPAGCMVGLIGPDGVGKSRRAGSRSLHCRRP